MPRICHVTTAHQSFDTRIFRRQCVSLARVGFEVTLVAQHPKEEVVEGVRVLPLRLPTSLFDRRYNLAREAAALAHSTNSDLYHFHDPELIPPMRKLARKTDRPVIWDAHENYVETIAHFNQLGIQMLSNLASQIFDKMEIAACVGDFAGVVTITETMARRYLKHGIKTAVIGNGPDLSSIPFPPSISRSTTPLLVSTGAQFGDRGIFEIVRAFEIIRRQIESRVAFWGSFDPPETRDVLIRELRAIGASDDEFEVSGPHSWKTLVTRLIPTAWAGCVLFNPSDENNLVGLPNRFFELWANAVPVIATSGTEVAKIVVRENGGIVIANNHPEEIARAFLSIVRSREEQALGFAARRAVESRYSWGLAFSELLKFYSSVEVSLSKTVCAE